MWGLIVILSIFRNVNSNAIWIVWCVKSWIVLIVSVSEIKKKKKLNLLHTGKYCGKYVGYVKSIVNRSTMSLASP